MLIYPANQLTCKKNPSRKLYTNGTRPLNQPSETQETRNEKVREQDQWKTKWKKKVITTSNNKKISNNTNNQCQFKSKVTGNYQGQTTGYDGKYGEECFFTPIRPIPRPPRP